MAANIPNSSATSCSLFPTEESHCRILVNCKRASAILSIIGCMLTLAIILLFKKYREFTQRLIANLSFVSLLFAVSFVISDFESTHTWLCLFQAAVLTYTEWAVMLAAMVILLALYSEICQGKALRRFEKPLLIVSWSIPLLLAGLPFTDNAYGPAGVWCWMKNKWWWRFGAFYIWKGISDVVFFVGIIRIWYVLLRRTRDVESSQRSELLDDIRTLRVYPVVYFLVFVGSWINRIHNAVTEGYSFGILLLQTITVPFFGALVAVTFVLDKRTRRLLTQKDVLNEIKKKWTHRTVIKEYQATPVAAENLACVQSSSTLQGSDPT